MFKKIFSILILIIIASFFLTVAGVFAEWRPGQPLPSPRPPEPQAPAPSPQPHIELFSLSITYFRTTTPSTALGDEETLRWRIDGKNVRDIRLEITPGVGSVPPGTRTDLGGEAFRIEGTRNVRPSRNTTYTLRVTGSGVGLGGALSPIEKTATVLVTVRRPRLENVQPEVNQRDLKIKFFARNTGDADFRPTSISVYYQVQGRGGIAPPGVLSEGTCTSPRVGIRTGEQVPLCEITLSDRQRALSSNELQIITDIGASYVLPLEGDRDTFTHRWEPTMGNLARPIGLVNLLLGAMKLRLHNDGGQDSYVELVGVGRMSFDIPEMRTELSVWGVHWGWYRSWIKDINNARIGLDAISISDGGITLNIPIEAGGPTEIRCVYDPLGVGGYTDDNACPDVDLRGPINAKATFFPTVIDGQIGYSRVNADVTIADTTFPGAWDWFIELFTGDLKPKIESESEKALKELLEKTEVKNAFRDAMARLLRESGFDVIRVTRIEVRGNELLFWYL